jgi:hypothetical protein
MTDWAGWGTSIGTLVLAGATFAALRSSNRSARIAERALLAGLRPLLMPSRPEDPGEHVQFADGRVLEARAGRALVDAQDRVIYLAIPLRNVGAGIAVLRGYHTEAETAGQAAQDPQGAARHRRGDPVPDPAVFAEQQRDPPLTGSIRSPRCAGGAALINLMSVIQKSAWGWMRAKVAHCCLPGSPDSRQMPQPARALASLPAH